MSDYRKLTESEDAELSESLKALEEAQHNLSEFWMKIINKKHSPPEEAEA